MIEMLMVIGILSFLLAISLPIGFNFYLDYQLDSEANLLDNTLREARNLAMINHHEADHGVYVASDELIVFQGSSYAARDGSQDRIFPRAAGIVISGPAETNFSALSGVTASSTFALTDPRSKTREIFVNPEGLVYE